MNDENNVNKVNNNEEAVVGNMSEADVKMEKATKKIEDGVKKVFDTDDTTKDYDKKDIESGKLLGCLSYIIAPIPYFTEKKNKFVMYHARRGMDLLAISVVFSIVSSILKRVIRVNQSCWGISNCYKMTPWWVEWPLNILSILISAFALIGIINVLNGKAKELPIIHKIKIFR